MKDLMDIRNETLITEIRRELRSINFWFNAYYGRLNNAAAREAFFYFIGNFTTNCEYLTMDFDGWNENEIGQFFTSIRSRDIKVCEIFVFYFKSFTFVVQSSFFRNKIFTQCLVIRKIN